jgi:hypothetical protein
LRNAIVHVPLIWCLGLVIVLLREGCSLGRGETFGESGAEAGEFFFVGEEVVAW